MDFKSDKSLQYEFIRKHFVEDDDNLVARFGPLDYSRFEIEADMTPAETKRRKMVHAAEIQQHGVWWRSSEWEPETGG